MQRGSEFETAVEEEWSKVLKHASVDPATAQLWIGRGPHQESAGASYYLPVRLIEGDHGLDGEQFAQANSEAFAGLHRVVVYPEYEPDRGEEIADQTVIPIFGAILRHELQHALQFEACGYPVFEIDGALVDHILSLRAGGLPGSMALCNTKPMEIDCNAAAACYLRDVHSEHVEPILNGPCAHLARSLTHPEDPKTLLTRTICFLYIHREICRGAAGDIPVANWIRTYDEAGAVIWEQLEAATNAAEASQKT